ncbi:MAG: cytochrome c3 family protein [Candidatus Scalindua sp.]
MKISIGSYKRNNYKEARPPEAPLRATFRSDSVGNAGEKHQNNLKYSIVKRIIYMYKIVSGFSLLVAILLLSFFSETSSVYAKEVLSKSERAQGSKISKKKVDSCTVRCHVNYMAYENKFEATQRVEIFRHKTHSFEQDLDCTSCHDSSEVNTDGHGKLTIKEENCLKCHHVELKESECKRCHQNIDENSMKYKEEKFIHGFTVESDVDCGLCHVKDSSASLKDEEINCVKCHHTTPNLDCAKCHENDLDKFHDTVPEKVDRLSWSVSFRHSQHPEHNLSCKECHSISHDVDSGIDEYKQNCSKCHHASVEASGCTQCHMEPYEFLQGKAGIDGVDLLPDMMFRVVKCEDCHRYNDEKLKFSEVEEQCVDCHNEDYGKLYSAWTKTIKKRLGKFNSRVQDLVENSNIDFLKESYIDDGKDVEAGGRSGLDTFINEAGVTVDLITKYGTHNFNLTRMILDRLEEKIK